MEKYRLRPLNSGYSEDYNINLDPSTANEAATAVLHFVISMMPGYLELQDLHNNSRKTQMETLRTFYAPDEVCFYMFKTIQQSCLTCYDTLECMVKTKFVSLHTIAAIRMKESY